jgi:phosphinothricin acetyltransferase
MVANDWPRVRDIYEEGIATANATFETEAPDWQQWDARHLSSCRLIAVDTDRIAGWAALSPVSARRVYAGVAEVSVYVTAAARGRGLGKALLKQLVLTSEQNGIWTLQAGIFPENLASVRLHKAFGFRTVGTRERLGRLAGQWRDVLLMERRSNLVGL